MKIKSILMVLVLMTACSEENSWSKRNSDTSMRLMVDSSFNAVISGKKYQEAKWIELLKEKNLKHQSTLSLEIDMQFNAKMIFLLICKVCDCGYQKFTLEVRNKQGLIENVIALASYDSDVYGSLTRISKKDFQNVVSLKDGEMLLIRVDETRDSENTGLIPASEIAIRKVTVDSRGSQSSLGMVKSGEIVFLKCDQDLNVLPLISISRNILKSTGRPPILLAPYCE